MKTADQGYVKNLFSSVDSCWMITNYLFLDISNFGPRDFGFAVLSELLSIYQPGKGKISHNTRIFHLIFWVTI
jgi:hypothetical protein